MLNESHYTMREQIIGEILEGIRQVYADETGVPVFMPPSMFRIRPLVEECWIPVADIGDLIGLNKRRAQRLCALLREGFSEKGPWLFQNVMSLRVVRENPNARLLLNLPTTRQAPVMMASSEDDLIG